MEQFERGVADMAARNRDLESHLPITPPDQFDALRELRVPVVAIYSKRDGIVAEEVERA